MIRIASLGGVLKPEYLFRPNQILRRLWRGHFGGRGGFKKARLPWNLEITVDSGESIGWSVYTRALYDTALTETLWRLARLGDFVIDVGANIGYMTSLLGVRVGKGGRVYAFEPHPSIFRELQLNVANWTRDKRCGQFVLHNAALGSHKGTGRLVVPDTFSVNKGTSYVSREITQSREHTFDVNILALDDVISHADLISVVKLDVQGYELSVLKGMENLLKQKRVRHVVFEEEGGFPAATHMFLTDMGYDIYGIDQCFWGIRFVRNKQPFFDPVNGPSPNFLATTASGTEVSSLTTGFWQSFGPAQLFWRI